MGLGKRHLESVCIVLLVAALCVIRPTASEEIGEAVPTALNLSKTGHANNPELLELPWSMDIPATSKVKFSIPVRDDFLVSRVRVRCKQLSHPSVGDLEIDLTFQGRKVFCVLNGQKDLQLEGDYEFVDTGGASISSMAMPSNSVVEPGDYSPIVFGSIYKGFTDTFNHLEAFGEWDVTFKDTRGGGSATTGGFQLVLTDQDGQDHTYDYAPLHGSMTKPPSPEGCGVISQVNSEGKVGDEVFATGQPFQPHSDKIYFTPSKVGVCTFHFAFGKERQGPSATVSIHTACGDGTLSLLLSEQCDDGNFENDDGCSSMCEIEHGWRCSGSPSVCEKCGDGVVQLEEDCDDGNNESGDGCSSVCRVEEYYQCTGHPSVCVACGDGIVQSDGNFAEQCDDGNRDNEDGCSSMCQVEEHWKCSGESTSICGKCGDGTVQGFLEEECDDGNSNNGDGCSSHCTKEDGWFCVDKNHRTQCQKCGDGRLQFGEECDDANTHNGDGCSWDCSIEDLYTCREEPSVCFVCGDGKISSYESCDDGNLEGGDGCGSQCSVEQGWICDGAPSTCWACGDGKVDHLEECDDGDRTNGDGCNHQCEVESGWQCHSNGASQSQCFTVCGDGTLTGKEQCDDANSEGGDGCNAHCEVEPSYVCHVDHHVGHSVCALACGNGQVDVGEECDEESSGCHNCKVVAGWSCSATPCVVVFGDGLMVEDEQCDDQNTEAEDGCFNGRLEVGWKCDGQPSNCTEICGDGHKTDGEGCDDGNVASGDGCDDTCDIEEGWECQGVQVSNCQRVEAIVEEPEIEPEEQHVDDDSAHICSADVTQYEVVTGLFTPSSDSSKWYGILYLVGSLYLALGIVVIREFQFSSLQCIVGKPKRRKVGGLGSLPTSPQQPRTPRSTLSATPRTQRPTSPPNELPRVSTPPKSAPTRTAASPTQSPSSNKKILRDSKPLSPTPSPMTEVSLSSTPVHPTSPSTVDMSSTTPAPAEVTLPTPGPLALSTNTNRHQTPSITTSALDVAVKRLSMDTSQPVTVTRQSISLSDQYNTAAVQLMTSPIKEPPKPPQPNSPPPPPMSPPRDLVIQSPIKTPSRSEITKMGPLSNTSCWNEALAHATLRAITYNSPIFAIAIADTILPFLRDNRCISAFFERQFGSCVMLGWASLTCLALPCFASAATIRVSNVVPERSSIHFGTLALNSALSILVLGWIGLSFAWRPFPYASIIEGIVSVLVYVLLCVVWYLWDVKRQKTLDSPNDDPPWERDSVSDIVKQNERAHDYLWSVVESMNPTLRQRPSADSSSLSMRRKTHLGQSDRVAKNIANRLVIDNGMQNDLSYYLDTSRCVTGGPRILSDESLEALPKIQQSNPNRRRGAVGDLDDEGIELAEASSNRIWLTSEAYVYRADTFGAEVTLARSNTSVLPLEVQYHIDDHWKCEGVFKFSPKEVKAKAFFKLPSEHQGSSFALRLRAAPKGWTFEYPDVCNLRLWKDEGADVFAFASPACSILESDGVATLSVLRIGPCQGTSSVKYKTSDVTAKAGRDYRSKTGTLTFEDGEASRVVTVNLVSGRALSDHVVHGMSYVFDVTLFEARTEGGQRVAIANPEFCSVGIVSWDGTSSLKSKVNSHLDNVFRRRVSPSDTYRGQISRAFIVAGPLDKLGQGHPPRTLDFVAHFVSFGWKLGLAILIPSVRWVGGWPAYLVSLVFVSAVSILLSDLLVATGALFDFDVRWIAIGVLPLFLGFTDMYTAWRSGQAVSIDKTQRISEYLAWSTGLLLLYGVECFFLASKALHSNSTAALTLSFVSVGYTVVAGCVLIAAALSFLKHRRLSNPVSRAGNSDKLQLPLRVKHRSSTALTIGAATLLCSGWVASVIVPSLI